MARVVSGERIRDARHAARMRPEHLAVAIGRSVDSIKMYEQGRVQPPVVVLTAIAEALAVPLDALLVDAAPAHVAVA